MQKLISNVKINNGRPHQNGVVMPQGGAYYSVSITGRFVNYSPQQKNDHGERINYRAQLEKTYIASATRN